ncbi:MAG: cyclase family protein [Dissulfuribacterales bacterium]
MTIFDISVPLGRGLPVWPGSIGMRLESVCRIENGDKANVSKLTCDVHTGTHIDAPSHFVSDGNTVEQISLDVLMGETIVADLTTVSIITPSDLAGLKLPPGTKRLLLHTKNSKLWEDYGNEFCPHFVALTPKAAQWVVDWGIKLLGIDYLSVEPFIKSTQQTHITLLSAGVVILEGLNLSQIVPGIYELICLPLKLVDAEGPPARAILRGHSNSE